MNSKKESQWPPLISGASVPWWMRLRDFLLTLSAWIFFVWLLRHPIAQLIDYLRPPVFHMTYLEPPKWGMIWQKLDIYARISLGLILWIIFWGIYRASQLRQLKDGTPAPLSAKDHAEFFHRVEKEIQAVQKGRHVRARFDDDNQLIGFEIK